LERSTIVVSRQDGDRCKRRQSKRDEPADRATQENDNLGRAIEPRVEPVARRGHEAKFARDAAVERVEDLSDAHEHERRDYSARREHGRRGRAHPKRRPGSPDREKARV